MRELVLTCAFALLGSGCVEVVSHIDDFDAGNPDVKVADDVAKEAAPPMGQCASGVRWMGTAASAVHYPGRSCLASNCHAANAKMPFTIAGTVYPVHPVKGDHDDDDCNGIDSSQMPSAVGIQDEMGGDVFPRLQVNTAGNFFTTKAVPPSYRVKVYSQGREISQISAVTDGNCNSCHSKDGVAGAKGRIIPQPP